jgi:hypothetical protein
MEAEIAPHSAWAVAQALALPELAIHDARVTPLGDDTWHVRVVVKNVGWLPTNVTQKAMERKAVRPVEVTVELPDGARLASGRTVVEVGQLPGRSRARTMLAMFDGGFDPSVERATADFVVHAPAGTVLPVRAQHARAGTRRTEVTLA